MSVLVDELRQGRPRALARAVTLVENRLPGAEDVVRALYRESGRARVVGITGSPGAGKSTLVDSLARRYSAGSARVGVIAVDPSSPFTGGAVLGDRVRMPGLEGIDGLFIRSMATRGNLGGLARATGDVVALFDASGRDPIFIETVGVGQDEVEVTSVAELTVVVLVPGMGDDVQALKAGIMEIGDIFVINKSDHPGADKIERTLETMLELSEDAGSKAIVRTVATEGKGIDELVAAIDSASTVPRHEERRQARRRRAVENHVRSLLEERLVERTLRSLPSPVEFDTLVDAVGARETDPYTAVDRLIQHVRFGEES